MPLLEDLRLHPAHHRHLPSTSAPASRPPHKEPPWHCHANSNTSKRQHFQDGENWIGVAEDYTPAKLSQKFEAYRGGGMMGAANIHITGWRMAPSTPSLLADWRPILPKRMGLAKIDGVALRFAGSIQRDDTGEVVAVEKSSAAASKSWTGATSRPATTQSKISMVNTYYKGDFMNGVELCRNGTCST